MAQRRQNRSSKARSELSRQRDETLPQLLKRERLQRKEALAREKEALAREKEALEQQAATSEILRAISSSPSDLQPVFDTIVRNFMALCGAVFGAVFTLDGELVHYAGGLGFSPERERAHTAKYPVRVDDPSVVSARTIMARAPVHINDTLTDPNYDAGRAATLGVRRIIGVPLLRDGVPVGAIVASWAEPGATPKRQERLLKTFADQAVIAIENARLFNETKEALAQQTASGKVLEVISGSPSDLKPVFDAILASATGLCEAHLAVLNLYDGTAYRTVAQLGTSHEFAEWLVTSAPFRPDPTTSWARVARDRQPLQVADLRESAAYRQGVPYAVRFAEMGGARTYLIVPLIKDERFLGAIAIFRPEVKLFSDKQVELVKTFARQAVIAMENVRLFNDTKEALERQTATAEILKVMSASPTDVQPVFEAVAQRAAQLCNAANASVSIDEGTILRRVATFGHALLPRIGRQPREPRRTWVNGRAFLERRTVHVEDVLAVLNEYPDTRENQQKLGFRSIVAVPMIREGKAVGTIGVWRREVKPFSETEIELLETFAAQAVIAIENVRLFNETKEALEQQKASADVLGVISGSIADTNPVFDKILQSCQRLFEGNLVGVTLATPDNMVDLAAYEGEYKEETKRMYPMPLSRESGTGCAILDRKVAHYPDVTEGTAPPRVVQGSRTMGFKGIIFAPMIFEARGIGAIWVARRAPGPFTEKQIALLKTFADQAVIAIQNARLFREIQEKSAQLEVANKHKSDFLANMSHELRTPLNAIIGFSEAMMDKLFGELNEKQSEYLKDIHESGKHLLSLINDILDLSKIEAGRMELELSTFHLPTAVSNAVILVRERAMRHGIALGMDIDQRLGEFQADERKVKQILLNLLSNAVKFTPDGGRVDVSAKLDTDQVEIAVKDTGVGITPEEQASLFEEFKQLGKDSSRKAEGTGLGLALTKRLVELHGGQILVDSAVGRGSMFRVMLPVRG